MSDMTHEFEELSLNEMEEVSGGHPVILTMFMIWAGAMVNTLNNGGIDENGNYNPNPFDMNATQDDWDATFGMG